VSTLTKIQFEVLELAVKLIKGGKKTVTKYDIFSQGVDVPDSTFITQRFQDLRRKGMVLSVRGGAASVPSGYIVTDKGFKAVKNPNVGRMDYNRTTSVTHGQCERCETKGRITFYKKVYLCDTCLIGPEKPLKVEDFAERRHSCESEYDESLDYGEAH
jgi:hypothetical protein